MFRIIAITQSKWLKSSFPYSRKLVSVALLIVEIYRKSHTKNAFIGKVNID